MSVERCSALVMLEKTIKEFEVIDTKGNNIGQRYTEFSELTKPLIKWLNENMHPFAKIIIDCSSAELVSGEIGFTTEEFIKD